MTTVQHDDHQAYLDVPDLISSGMLKIMAKKTPLHVWSAYLDKERLEKQRLKDEKTDSMDLGRALHTKFLLGDEAFGEEFILTGEIDKRTKDGKAKWAAIVADAEMTGKTVIRPNEDLDHLERMCRSLRANKHVEELMEGTEREISCYGEDGKIRLDAYGGKHKIAIDLKSIAELEPHLISNAIARYGYHVQAAWYLRIAIECGLDIDPDKFCFIFIETKPPYDCAIRMLSQEALDRGREIVDKHYPVLKHCMDADDWPGFGAEGMQIADIPIFAYSDS